MKLLKKLFPDSSGKREEKVCFTLLFQGRTGSTYVTDRVNAHPNVIMEPEVWGGWGFQLQQNELSDHIQKQHDWLSTFYLKERHSGAKAIGFKTKLSDVLDKRYFMNFLREHQIRIILLTRRNTIKLVISEINAQRLFDQASTWNLMSESSRLPSFTLDLDKFNEQLQWREKVEQWLTSYCSILNLPTKIFYYEDMLSDSQEFFAQLYDFLRVPFRDTVGKTLKNTPNDLRQVINNYEELLDRYQYTVYEPMILDA
jgi:hypothetical protein